jgi:hypothetical protein
MTHHLAQLNIARWSRSPDAPENADFHANLDRINALAEAQPGFVWRLTGEGNNATDVVAFDDTAVITNMSVWRDMESLAAFVYRTGHRDIMRRRAEWFDRMETYMVLWWVPVGHEPTVGEAKARLAHLAAHGPSPEAFTFREPFPAPGEAVIAPVLERCD